MAAASGSGGADAPSFRSKASFFRQLDALRNGIDDDDGDADGMDALGREEEERHRARSRAYRAAMLKNGGRRPLEPLALDARGEPTGAGRQANPRRTVSAPSAPGSGSGSPSASMDRPGRAQGRDRETIIERTPAGMARPVAGAGPDGAKRVPLAELDSSVIVIEDTPVVPDSARQPLQALRRSATTPLPVPKRLLSGGAATARADDHSSPSVGRARKRRRRNEAGPALSSSAATPPPPSSSSSPTTGLAPEAERIFRDLSFYYIPDDDVAKLRRIRIAKAREHGARWVRRVEEATHVIVDRGLAYGDVEALLAPVVSKATTATTRRVEVVNEEYPLDCIMFRRLLNPDQKAYRVKGFPERAKVAHGEKRVTDQRPEAAGPLPELEHEKEQDQDQEQMQDQDQDAELSASQDSVVSLQMRPPERNPARWDYVLPHGTPSGSQPSDSDQALPLSQLVRLDLPAPSEDMGEPRERTSQQAESEANQAASRPPETQGAESQTAGGPADGKAPAAPGDDLSEYIELMREFKGLPLDEDDDDTSTMKDAEELSDLDAGSDGEAQPRRQRKKGHPALSGDKKIAWEDRFACNSAGPQDSKSDNPNSRTIEVLQSMCNYYDRINDHWRTTAYRKAISTLRRQTTKIVTAEQAYKLPSVGARLAQKIEEIATTDRLRRLEYTRDEPLDGAFQTFLGIYGVGNSQAARWVAQGFRTLDDLLRGAKLSSNQRVGIERYDDLNSRIPRPEVTALGEVVKRTAARLDRDVELIIGGSYRRGAPSSGDIDLIITKRGTTSSGELMPFLERLIATLEAEGFIVATLAASGQRSGHDGSKWHGCCVLPEAEAAELIKDGAPSKDGKEGEALVGGEHGATAAVPMATTPYRPVWRRIDFLLVPETEMGAALIYFTGNDIFNRSIRLLASKKGMRLNQRGLYRDVMRGPSRVKVTEGQLVEGRDERKIFEILGVRWREPHERWC